MMPRPAGPAAVPAAPPAVLGTTRTLSPGNRGTEMGEPAVRAAVPAAPPAVLGATRTLSPGNRGTEKAVG